MGAPKAAHLRPASTLLCASILPGYLSSDVLLVFPAACDRQEVARCCPDKRRTHKLVTQKNRALLGPVLVWPMPCYIRSLHAQAASSRPGMREDRGKFPKSAKRQRYIWVSIFSNGVFSPLNDTLTVSGTQTVAGLLLPRLAS